MLLDERILNLQLPQRGQVLTPKEAMRLCIDLAFQGIAKTSPNPMVGCVIVDEDHKFLAGGFHHKYGDLHAETDAWKQLPASATYRNLIVYVSLEPCAHEGKQPSCAKILAQKPVRTIHFAVHDPNPLVSGKGQSILNAAGIGCEVWQEPKLVSEAHELMHAYLTTARRSSPYVVLKVATDSLGVFALNSSKKLWITNERSRQYAHFLRAYYDAILVGRDTVIQDNPILDTRFFKPELREKPVVVLDPQADILRSFPGSSLHILQDKHRKVFWAVEASLRQNDRFQSLLDKLEIEPIFLPYANHSLDLQELLSSLWQRNIRSIFVEGGAHAFAGFLNQKLVDRLYHFQTHEPLVGENKRFWYEKCHQPPSLGEPMYVIPLDNNTLNIYELKSGLL